MQFAIRPAFAKPVFAPRSSNLRFQGWNPSKICCYDSIQNFGRVVSTTFVRVHEFPTGPTNNSERASCRKIFSQLRALVLNKFNTQNSRSSSVGTCSLQQTVRKSTTSISGPLFGFGVCRGGGGSRSGLCLIRLWVRVLRLSRSLPQLPIQGTLELQVLVTHCAKPTTSVTVLEKIAPSKGDVSLVSSQEKHSSSPSLILRPIVSSS